MQPYEKTFRNSFGGIFTLIFIFLLFIFFAVIAFVSDSEIYIRIILGIFLAAIAFLTVYFLYNFARSVKVTDEEITIQKLFGIKSLRWDEIERVSVEEPYLRLHSRDGRVTLSIGSQMNGYAELLDLFFKKHSKLFKAVESEFVSQRKYGGLFAFLFILFLLSAGIYAFQESDWFFVILSIGFGFFILYSWPREPNCITWLDDKIVVTYPFREASYYARWIDSITLGETKLLEQVSHYVKINLKMGNSISLFAFPHNGLLAYRSLQRWHKKALENETVRTF